MPVSASQTANADSPATSASQSLRDRRIASRRPLVPPELLREELPIDSSAAATVVRGRTDAAQIVSGVDDRLLAVVGPCSVHDEDAAFEYATRLAPLAAELADEVCVVMRVYFEKPRTTLGWKGLINDPGLDGSYRVNEGLRTARSLLLDIVSLGLPVGCEFLDPITPQFIDDVVSWGSIGARTAHSQVHRQLSSGLSMPIGIKNAPDGNVQAAVDAVRASAASHVFTGVGDDGLAAIFTTSGNPDCHVVLRGSSAGPNYDAATVADTARRLTEAGHPRGVLIDASHGNSGKDHRKQPVVVGDLAARVAAGERAIAGVMLESFLVEGRQDLVFGQRQALTRGQSITDACVDWASTEKLLRQLAEAVRARKASTTP
ncbi:3-deoxy-D-arabinoheptulosonate-7-phosphate synthase [Tamaricihabitans halophyticus]|uniref:Phospho-2-dehydro-3-deoxyheptonate aldolase n=1 Tax=Tamaricihabitans halophyticus TaxID=1262583 RepID=A0A4R2QY07_9PSEU|nr:3-deoxy-7-phosphoheptulonate synthase [Tamaricihabitans halophyticus]TCP54049.1 3-deoxy-D-arabinoheptulosonate-7-phosphate synthase [Tamaricihabitans halophyticus]